VLEALLVMCRVELDKGDRQVVKFTRDQLFEVLRVRKRKPTYTPQALSTEYLPRFVTRRDAKKPKASVLELLVRTEKGRTGVPSTYELTAPMRLLLGLDPRQAQKGPSEARSAAQRIPAGPEAVPPSEPAEAAEAADLISLPEDDNPQDDACVGAYARTKAKTTAGLEAKTAAGLDELPEDDDPTPGVSPVPDDDPLSTLPPE
jgi:hypothetical protein